ncbi:MAG: M48 family metalloprotease [Gammaproteobacteria bacterium]
MSATPTANEYQALEQLYKTKPDAYRSRVKRFIALGYGYVVVSVLVIVGFILGGAYLFGSGTLRWTLVDEFLQMGVPAVVVAGLMIRALFVKVPTPSGTYLSGELKDRVIEFFEPVRQKSGGLKIHEVVVVPELNAAISQRTRFGMFGSTTNYLMLGLPLLQLLDEEEVQAVVAHEFGHLSHQHGRMGATVYRLDTTLSNVASTLNEKTKKGVNGFAFKFFHWFYPKFNTLTFAMRRGQEYEADEVAANATNPNAIASSLCKLYALHEPLGQHWDQTWSISRKTASNADAAPHARMRDEVSRFRQADAESAAVEQAMLNETNFQDTHPCLRDRLSALNVGPVLHFEDKTSAFEALFNSDQQTEMLNMMDSVWRESSAENWQSSHQQYAAAEDELAQLMSQKDELIDGQKMYRLASLQESLNGTTESRPYFKRLVEEHRDSAVAQFHWGRVNIESNIDVAEEALLASVQLDLEMTPDVRRVLTYGYEQHGVAERAIKLSPFEEKYEKFVQASEEESGNISTEDKLIAPSIDPELLDTFRNHLQENHPEINKLYVVQKDLEVTKGKSVFLFAYFLDIMHDNVEDFDDDEWVHQYTQNIIADYPVFGSPFSLVLIKPSPWIEHLEAIEGSLLHEGSRSTMDKLKRAWTWIQVGFGVVAVIAVVVLLIMAFLNGEF